MSTIKYRNHEIDIRFQNFLEQWRFYIQDLTHAEYVGYRSKRLFAVRAAKRQCRLHDRRKKREQ